MAELLDHDPNIDFGPFLRTCPRCFVSSQDRLWKRLYAKRTDETGATTGTVSRICVRELWQNPRPDCHIDKLARKDESVLAIIHA